jgi:ketosteroid isomerase-like protein
MGYEAFNQQRFDDLLAAMVPDFEWHEAAEIPGRKSCQSREEFARYMRGFEQLWETFRMDPQELIAAGDDTLYARILMTGRGKASADDVEFEIHHVWRLRDGLFARMNAYLDEGEAKAAAGLE